MRRWWHNMEFPAHRFVPGDSDGAPLLVPLARTPREVCQLSRFCNSIFPGAPRLVPLLARERLSDEEIGVDSEDLLIERFDIVIRAGVSLHRLEMIPVTLVGHGDGADLAIRVAMRCASRLSACILLRPQRAPTAEPGCLDGVAVLLAYDARTNGAGGVAQELRRMMNSAGAAVVSQLVAQRNSPGGLDSAICHVFLEALFPAAEPYPGAR
jgi:hypothetical protein